RDFVFPGFPGIVCQLEFGADRPGGDDSGAVVIARHVVCMIVPNAEPAATAAPPDPIIIQSFTAIVVIIAVVVPLVDDKGARALDPHIHATGYRALGWNQFLVVYAMRDAI